MKIGPDLEITADQYGWTLTHWVPGHAKDGTPKRHKRQTYYASLIQACEAALERVARESASGTAQEVIAAVSRAQAAIREAVAARA